MSYNEITGDLFTADAQALAHGVNCKGVMGAGIASEFARRYPRMLDKYIERCKYGLLRPSAFFFWAGSQPMVYNLGTQMFPGADASLHWIRRSVDAMLTHAEGTGIESIAMPHIGCGIGGLEWSDVRVAIKELAEASPVALTVYSLTAES
jgi:O-acetyl-ADP-ribose deacetylase (regulator of RNase III)